MDNIEQEFDWMVWENKSTIYTVCYMFSNNPDEVADLFQDVLVHLWQGFAKFERRSDIRTWIYRVSMNVCLSADRKKKRRKTEPLTLDIDPFEDTDPNSVQMEMLRKRISKLDVFDRAIIMLLLENMSYEEIGAVMGISAKNVGVVIGVGFVVWLFAKQFKMIRNIRRSIEALRDESK